MVREIQMKTTMKHHFTPTRMALARKTTASLDAVMASLVLQNLRVRMSRSAVSLQNNSDF